MLWPVGRISSNGFSPLSQLLHSAANGVRAASSSVRIMVHLADGWDTGTINWFYGGIFLQGQFAREDIDILGFSFYPFYNTRATYANLANGLQAAVSLVGKDVMVVETDWPATSTCSATMSESSIARSAAGQQTWVNGIRSVLQNVPSGRALVSSTGNQDNLLVDGSGNTRSSIAMFSTNMRSGNTMSLFYHTANRSEGVDVKIFSVGALIPIVLSSYSMITKSYAEHRDAADFDVVTGLVHLLTNLNATYLTIMTVAPLLRSTHSSSKISLMQIIRHPSLRLSAMVHKACQIQQVPALSNC
ncbi:glycoside hydrolase family protein [Salix suchowensis]|nr:glycoside hydrolase family protein [Salix suchowensis]